jgi:hypothetical protein
VGTGRAVRHPVTVLKGGRGRRNAGPVWGRDEPREKPRRGVRVRHAEWRAQMVCAAAVLPERLPALLRIVNIILEHFGHVSNICCVLKEFAVF